MSEALENDKPIPPFSHRLHPVGIWTFNLKFGTGASAVKPSNGSDTEAPPNQNEDFKNPKKVGRSLPRKADNEQPFVAVQLGHVRVKNKPQH